MRTAMGTSAPMALVPATQIFSTLVQLPELDLMALGFNPTRPENHP